MCRNDQAEYNKSLEKSCKSSKETNPTCNEDKCNFSTTKLKTLDFIIEN